MTKPWEDPCDLLGNLVIDPEEAHSCEQEDANLCFAAQLQDPQNQEACRIGRKLAFGDARELGLRAVEMQLNSF